MNRCVPFVLALMTSACGPRGGASATTPIPTAPSAPPPPANVILRGWVYDTAFRIVAGAGVEIVEGGQAGQSATTNDRGQFEFSGAFVGSVTLRATKDGYTAATQRLNISQSSAIQY